MTTQDTSHRTYVGNRIGTVIHGTLNETDLLTAFAIELTAVSRCGEDELCREAYLEAGNPTENASEVISELMDALQEYAPAHIYFGNTEGDGSDFGWWWSDPRETCHCESLNGDEFLDTECNVRVTISDHGNVEVYDAATGANLYGIV